MSKYTTEVRFICENSAGLLESAGYSSVNEVIDKAIPKIFNFEFPIFDEAYRNVLCRKILKHYYTREIGEETVGLWKLRLDTRMNEIMPYYNQLYKSELLEFNPLYDTELTRSGNRTNNSTDKQDVSSERKLTGSGETNNENTENSNTTTSANTSTTNSTESTERDLYSDTPQGALNNVEDEDYLTNARKKLGSESSADTGTSSGTSENETTGSSKSTTTTTNNDTFTSEQNNNANSTEEYLEKVSGKQGSVSTSKLLMEYRSTFLNIDMQVIEELSDLFITLW